MIIAVLGQIAVFVRLAKMVGFALLDVDADCKASISTTGPHKNAALMAGHGRLV